MESSLARYYLERSQSMKRKNTKELKARVQAGKCIGKVNVRNGITVETVPCENDCVSRGLCDCHRQRYYLELRKLGSKKARLDFEEKSLALGLILAKGEQESWQNPSPFEEAMN